MNNSQKNVDGTILGQELERIRAGIKKEIFAEFLGISTRTLYRYENGERIIPSGLMKLAKSDQWTIEKRKYDNSAVEETKGQFGTQGGWQQPDIEERSGFPPDHDIWQDYKALLKIYYSENKNLIRNAHNYLTTLLDVGMSKLTSVPQASDTGPVDIEIMTRIMIRVEQHLAKKGNVSAEKRARLYSLLYERETLTGIKTDNKTIVRHLKLVQIK